MCVDIIDHRQGALCCVHDRNGRHEGAPGADGVGGLQHADPEHQ